MNLPVEGVRIIDCFGIFAKKQLRKLVREDDPQPAINVDCVVPDRGGLGRWSSCGPSRRALTGCCRAIMRSPPRPPCAAGDQGKSPRFKRKNNAV
jgi:hypothetical protein